MARDPDFDRELGKLFQAKRAGDSHYLIESLARQPEFANSAAKWLADAGDRAAIPALIRLLDASSSDARMAGAYGLMRFGPPNEARARLIEMAELDDADSVRSWAIGALGEYRDSELLPFFASRLNDPSWKARGAAAQALGKTGDRRAREVLRQGWRRERRSLVGWFLTRTGYRSGLRELKRARKGVKR